MGRPGPSQAGASRQPKSQAASKGPGEARGRPSFLPAALRGVVSEQRATQGWCVLSPRAAWPGLALFVLAWTGPVYPCHVWPELQ